MQKRENENRIAVVGLGNLGKAIASALHNHQLPISVWNRTRENTLSCFDGSKLNGRPEVARTLEEAILHSEIILICVSDFDAVKSIVGSMDERCNLDGKILLQFSTLDIQQARQISVWACSRNVSLIECSFLGIPTDVVNKTATVLCSGSLASYRSVGEILGVLGTSEHISEEYGAIYEFDKSYYCFAYSLLIGFIQGAALADASGYSISTYARIVADRMPFFADKVELLGEEMMSGNYETSQATIRVWSEAFHNAIEQCHKVGIDGRLPEVLADIMQDSILAGHGDQSLSAITELLSAKSIKN